MAKRSPFVAGHSRFAAGRFRLWQVEKKNKSGAKRGAKADSQLGPRTKVNAMTKKGQTLNGCGPITPQETKTTRTSYKILRQSFSFVGFRSITKKSFFAIFISCMQIERS